MITPPCFHSPVGPLWLAGNHHGLHQLAWIPLESPPFPARETTLAWLTDYFAGYFRTVDFPLVPPGTPWQQHVWQTLLTIAPGHTLTYGALSAQVGGSARAVGQANAANPIPIIIPCHRVVAQHGLGGYSGQGGLITKEWLLHWEARHTTTRVALPQGE